MSDGFIRVTKSNRCPICGKPDWCMIARDGTAAICPRVPEGGKYLGDAGWLHRLTNDPPKPSAPRVYAHPKADFNAEEVNNKFRHAVDPSMLEVQSALIRVSTLSLKLLGVGYSDEHQAFSFPMRSHTGAIIGIRLRAMDGKKFAVSGSRSGLFIGPKRDGIDLYVCEGPTDAAALIDLDCWVVAKPSCNGGNEELARYVGLHKPKNIIIVSDRDGPGVAGAERTADILSSKAVVRVIEPLAGKDIREWKMIGCNASTLSAVVINTQPWFKPVALTGRAAVRD